MTVILLALSVLSCLIWLYLLAFRGGFWKANQCFNKNQSELATYPAIIAVVPARDEADVLPFSLRSLLAQDYPGEFSVILIDDRSTDGTAEVAAKVAESIKQTERIMLISGEPLPSGWSGKLWAMEQGIQYVQKPAKLPDYFLFTDADIKHHQTNLKELAAKAVSENLDLTSLMVRLRCESFWEKFLIPPFVFFFQKLYPFAWANDPQNKLAAAAGGCILIRREALERIGGLSAICQTLIDDCSLAQAVKSSKLGTKIWLGLTDKTCSLRSYPSLKSIWDLVARTAFTQLNYSPLLLLGTVTAMVLIYLAPPIGALLGILSGNNAITSFSLLAWLLMVIAYFPTLKFYRRSPLEVVTLPAIACLYTLMTIDSALRHWQGRGGGWKGRVY
jgi:hopene-associated glycosyltransferase HpnB